MTFRIVFFFLQKTTITTIGTVHSVGFIYTNCESALKITKVNRLVGTKLSIQRTIFDMLTQSIKAYIISKCLSLYVYKSLISVNLK